MDFHMLPTQSYIDAIPFLRMPYSPSLVRGLIVNVPTSPRSPCTVGLYSIGETLMDRLNLTCGHEWAQDCEFVNERTFQAHGKTFYYCEAKAILEVFGVVRKDIGASTAETSGQAKMNAQAQAWKRAGRLHGPGQCLYSVEDFLLERGEEPGKLRVPKSGENSKARPYIDRDCELVIREQYKRWLTDEGKQNYGAPLNHQEVADAIMARMRGNGATGGVATARRANARARSAATANGKPAGEHQAPGSPSQPAPGHEAEQQAGPAEDFGPMPEHPAAPAVIDAAKSRGFAEPVARLLSNLVRADGQDTNLTDAQLQALTGWLEVLSALQTPEEMVLRAAGHNSDKPIGQERRQAMFARWLARKTAGTETTETEEQPKAQPTPQDSTGAQDPQDAARDRQDELQRALGELRRRMTEHDYDDRAVTRFAALATGGGPSTQVNWAQIDPDTLLILADLLESAAAIGWSNEQLDQAILAAHKSSKQKSTAGRFSALANHIKDLAETRVMETA